MFREIPSVLSCHFQTLFPLIGSLKIFKIFPWNGWVSRLVSLLEEEKPFHWLCDSAISNAFGQYVRDHASRRFRRHGPSSVLYFPLDTWKSENNFARFFFFFFLSTDSVPI